MRVKKRLPTGLYALTPDCADDDWLAGAVAAAIRGGASAVQYRNKVLDAVARLRQAQRLAEVCRAGGALFIVNDSVELARAVQADGVHLGREDAEPSLARAALGPAAIIGVSCYDSLERALALREWADYCAFGSVFPSVTKPDAVRAPLALFGQARAAGLYPVAIGGIDAGNVAAVTGAGAAAAAVITAAFGEGREDGRVELAEIESRAREIVEAFEARRRSMSTPPTSTAR